MQQNRRNCGCGVTRQSFGAGLRWLTLLGVAVTLLGCQTSRTIVYQRPLPPKPRKAQPPPPDAKTNAVVLTLGAAPRDTNGNGYPDMIHATTHLFDRRYAPPLHEDGSFVFELYAPGESATGEPLHSWLYEGDDVLIARGLSGFGFCYRFRLSLLDSGGTDQLGVSMADMVCRFVPAEADASTVNSEATTLQMGRVLVPQLTWREQRSPEPDPAAAGTARLEVWP